MTILDAIADPALFSKWFSNPETWTAWRAFMAALFGLPMTDAEAAIFAECTGRATVPKQAHGEAWLVCGRRAGKSFVLALVAVFLACFRDYRAALAPGERATILIIATDRRQARVIYRYARALIHEVPMLAPLIEAETAETITLSNRVSIEVATASFRRTRGYALAAALCDELAFWRSDDAAEPDYAVLDALRPGMATIPGAMLLCASSPYSRRGALWDAWRRHFGNDGDPVLVWQAPTLRMNATVRQSVIDAALERDPASASAEFFAQFRSDLEAFVSRDAVAACVSPGVRERPRVDGIGYVGFCDPSGGSADSMTLGIAHCEGAGAVLDLVRERRPPFSPEAVVAEFAETLRAYGISTVHGDRYAGMWPRERFAVHGIEYRTADQAKSQIYQTLLPMLNSGQIDLLDDDRLVTQLVGLERRTSRGGRDLIDHAPGAHDDAINAAAGALVAARPTLDDNFEIGCPVSISGPGISLYGDDTGITSYTIRNGDF